MNFRKGDIVEVAVLGDNSMPGVIVSTKGTVAQIYYPQLSGCIWIPFDLIIEVKGNDGEVQ